jgi:hypothetical protein
MTTEFQETVGHLHPKTQTLLIEGLRSGPPGKSSVGHGDPWPSVGLAFQVPLHLHPHVLAEMI